MTTNEQELYAVFNQVRICFNQLKTLAETLHKDLGINPSMRAVMEALSPGDPLTVPDIAQRRSVSRQHIQNVMNTLLTDELVIALDNPAHKRSLLYELTDKGQAAFLTISEREKEPLYRLAEGMSAEYLASVSHSLKELNHHLAKEISKGDLHDNSAP